PRDLSDRRRQDLSVRRCRSGAPDRRRARRRAGEVAAMSALGTAAEIAAAVAGQAAGDFAMTGVSIDSRSVEKGDLFVALQGPTFDGHDFVASALQRGAAGALLHRRPAPLP